MTKLDTKIKFIIFFSINFFNTSNTLFGYNVHENLIPITSPWFIPFKYCLCVFYSLCTGLRGIPYICRFIWTERVRISLKLLVFYSVKPRVFEYGSHIIFCAQSDTCFVPDSIYIAEIMRFCILSCCPKPLEIFSLYSTSKTTNFASSALQFCE